MNRAERRAKKRARGRLWPDAGRDELHGIARRCFRPSPSDLVRMVEHEIEGARFAERDLEERAR